MSTQQTLTSPVKRYVERLVDASERLSAELAIAQKESHDRKRVLEGRRRQKSGKRHVIKGQVLLTTKEIQDGVKAAEAETAAKKVKGKKKRKISSYLCIGSNCRGNGFWC